jgi:hypothetical protein
MKLTTHFVHVHIDVVRLCLCTAANDGLIVRTPADMSMKTHCGMILTGKTKELGEKHGPVPLYPPQILYMALLASAVRGRRPTRLSHGIALQLTYMLMC